MTRGDRPGPIVSHVQRCALARHPMLFGILFILVALAFLPALLPSPAQAVPDTQWVLTQTLVNPEKVNLEYYGGGKTPGFFEEERFKDMVMIHKPSATGFSVKDRWQDREYIAWDVTITCSFSAPEATLVPGKAYKLTATFSHTGTTTEPHPGEVFTYYSPDFGLDPNESLAYYPSRPGPASKTWSFTAPAGAPGDTVEIQAGLWNAPGCTVIWKYEARAVTPEYGVIEIDGVIRLVSPPGGVLRISRADLPEWARDAVATVGDEVACVGPPATLTEGDSTVLLDGKPVARAGDGTTHGGTVVSGDSRILVNGVPAATIGDFVTCPMLTGKIPHVGGPIIGRPGTAASTSTSAATTTQSQTSTSVSAASPSATIEPNMTEEEFQTALAETMAANGTMKDGYIGVAVAVAGDCSLYDYAGRLKANPIRRGELIRIGDTIVSGTRAGVRVQMADRDEARGAGPSVINIGPDSGMAFSKFLGTLSDTGKPRTMVDLLWGSVRTFFKGFGRNSSVSVKTGATICGIRGSDVFIFYDPENEVVVPPGQEGPVEYLGAWVLEGHLDVTSSVTGETVSLTDRQTLMAIDGAITPLGSFTQDKWDDWIQATGLEDMRILSAEELDEFLTQTTVTVVATATTTSVSPTTVTPSGLSGSGPGSTSGAQLSGGMLALIVVLAVVVAAAVGVGVMLLRRGRQRATEVAAVPGEGAVASPGFCRHCGSAVTPGSTFCGICGKSL